MLNGLASARGVSSVETGSEAAAAVAPCEAAHLVAGLGGSSHRLVRLAGLPSGRGYSRRTSSVTPRSKTRLASVALVCVRVCAQGVRVVVAYVFLSLRDLANSLTHTASTWRDVRAARRLLERSAATPVQTRRLAVRDSKLSAAGQPSGGATARRGPDRKLCCGAATGTRHDRRAAEAAQLGRPPPEGGQRGGPSAPAKLAVGLVSVRAGRG